MLIIGPIGFTAPWALLALAILPVLWWLLRVTPPPPKVVAFPAIRLLRDLVQPEESAARTPPWLILFRLALTACVIVGLAGPVLHPEAAASRSGTLLVVVDNGWSSAVNWPARQSALGEVLDRAERGGRTIVVLPTAKSANGIFPTAVGPARASVIRADVNAIQPMPWPVDRDLAASVLGRLRLSPDSEALWLSDGVNSPGAEALAHELARFAAPKILFPGGAGTPELLLPPSMSDAKLSAAIVRPVTGEADTEVRALASDGRIVGSAKAHFAADARTANAVFDLPLELANEVDKLELAGQHSVGGTVLLDTRWRRRPVGVVSAGGNQQSLLSGNPYLKAALAPFAELREGTLDTLLKRPLSTLILDDPAALSEADQASVSRWIETGGVLIRFAGPHLSATTDGLVPVKLHDGDRALGGALSWSQPEHIAPFPVGSPFAGLTVPTEVTVSRQLLAEPSPDLAKHTWAALADGTPLVTAAPRGKGWIVLVHTTAGPDWSNLALSGVFEKMLRRASELGSGVAAETIVPGSLPPALTLDGFATLGGAPATALPVEATKFDATQTGPSHPPGYYGTGAARRALNLTAHLTDVSPLPAFSGLTVAGYQAPAERSLVPLLLALALLMLAGDTVIGLWLKGLLTRTGARAGTLTLLILLFPLHARAQNGDKLMQAATATTLGYVQTGDSSIDQVSQAGLKALAGVLVARTSVEETAVQPVSLENDPLSLYPLLYWPVTQDQETPSPAAVTKLNTYLADGGMILFDKRDPEEGTPGSTATLRRLTTGLNLPALEKVPVGHTLRKSFYLIDSFPGRYSDAPVYVERVPSDRNDAVSSVVVGSNDWASAWAVDETGMPMAQVDGGERQRELAYRFGINLVMYALTGNYKSDQIHTPIILERLGK